MGSLNDRRAQIVSVVKPIPKGKERDNRSPEDEEGNRRAAARNPVTTRHTKLKKNMGR